MEMSKKTKETDKGDQK
jgi:hypothetical protein